MDVLGGTGGGAGESVKGKGRGRQGKITFLLRLRHQVVFILRLLMTFVLHRHIRSMLRKNKKA